MRAGHVQRRGTEGATEGATGTTREGGMEAEGKAGLGGTSRRAGLVEARQEPAEFEMATTTRWAINLKYLPREIAQPT